ncbi:MAG: CRISPR-associated endonuclease Cas1 [Rhodospirillaceae bacterium]|nr:CRISPR-associated endonuclease Cas1 [Rhodospirillaceae bacterium]
MSETGLWGPQLDFSTLPANPEIATHEWAERCGYWRKSLSENAPKRKRRERQDRPMILAGHGISISVDKGTLLIRDGNTHYPDPKTPLRYFKGDLNLPPRIVLVDGSGAITLDAIDWLTAQKVDLIRLDWQGHIVTVASATGYAADPKKVAWQFATRSNEPKRVSFAIPLIRTKIEQTLFNLREILPPSRYRDSAIENASDALRVLKSNPPRTVSKLAAIEGVVAQGYFYAWRALDMKWKAVSRYPIPDDWKQYLSRSTLNTKTRVRNKRATHPINAMLNYAYGVLEASTRIQVIAEGYDPTIGIMHDSLKPEKHSFVHDRMEPMRPVADRTILKLIKEQTFSGADFVLQKDGVCRLNPEMARNLVADMSLLSGRRVDFLGWVAKLEIQNKED